MRSRFQRVYLWGGTVAHVVPEHQSLNDGCTPIALCGRAPLWPWTWLGTGSQDEHERKAALRLCHVCNNRLTPEDGPI